MSTARIPGLPDKCYKHACHWRHPAAEKSNSKIFLVEVHLDDPRVLTMSFNLIACTVTEIQLLQKR